MSKKCEENEIWKLVVRDDEVENILRACTNYDEFISNNNIVIESNSVYKIKLQPEKNDKFSILSCKHNGRIIYRYVRGSHAYGLDVETSDTDTGGVFITDFENLLNLGDDYEEEAISRCPYPEYNIDIDIKSDYHPKKHKNDHVLYELRKFGRLLIKSNPTVLESLFINSDLIIFSEPCFDSFIVHNNEFLTKAAFPAFEGMAYSQIKKAQGEKKKIVNPVEDGLTITDFIYLPYKQGSTKLMNYLDYRGMYNKYCGACAIPNMFQCYGLYYSFYDHFKYEGITLQMLIDSYNDKEERDTIRTVKNLKKAKEENDTEQIEYLENEYKKCQLHNMLNTISQLNQFSKDNFIEDLTNWFNSLQPKGYRGLVSQNEDKQSFQLRLESIKKGDKYISLMTYNDFGYHSYLTDLRNYKDWEVNRNQERYRINVESGRKYDAKNMSHCCRILAMLGELATKGEFNVDRRNIDRDWLLEVKNAKVSYEDIMTYANKLKDTVSSYLPTSTLPEEVDVNIVNDIILEISNIFYKLNK